VCIVYTCDDKTAMVLMRWSYLSPMIIKRQIIETLEAICEEITPKFKYSVLLTVVATEYNWMQLREYNEKWYKEMLKALEYSKIKKS